MDTPSTKTPRIDFCTLRDVKLKGSDVPLGEGIYGKVFEVEYMGTDLTAQQFQIELGLEGGVKIEDFIQGWNVATRHPNIVQFMGVWYRDGNNRSFPAIVTERMRHNLRSLMESHDDALKIDFYHKMLILRDVSNGLRYLHSQNPAIVHYGLTPSNIILLGCSHCCMTAKITNVGVAKAIKIPHHTFDSGFLPPEAANDDIQPSFDIFAFGMVLWYTAVNTVLPKLGNIKQLTTEFRELQKNFDTIKAGDSTSFKSLLRSCWDQAPDKRPSIIVLSEVIKNLIHTKHNMQVKNVSKIVESCYSICACQKCSSNNSFLTSNMPNTTYRPSVLVL